MVLAGAAILVVGVVVYSVVSRPADVVAPQPMIDQPRGDNSASGVLGAILNPLFGAVPGVVTAVGTNQRESERLRLAEAQRERDRFAAWAAARDAANRGTAQS